MKKELKTQWMEILKNAMLENFVGLGRNNKPTFDNYNVYFPLSDKTMVEVNTQDLSFINTEYCDGLNIISVNNNHDNVIVNTQQFKELQYTIENLYIDLWEYIDRRLYSEDDIDIIDIVIDYFE